MIMYYGWKHTIYMQKLLYVVSLIYISDVQFYDHCWNLFRTWVTCQMCASPLGIKLVWPHPTPASGLNSVRWRIQSFHRWHRHCTPTPSGVNWASKRQWPESKVHGCCNPGLLQSAALCFGATASTSCCLCSLHVWEHLPVWTVVFYNEFKQKQAQISHHWWQPPCCSTDCLSTGPKTRPDTHTGNGKMVSDIWSENKGKHLFIYKT